MQLCGMWNIWYATTKGAVTPSLELLPEEKRWATGMCRSFHSLTWKWRLYPVPMYFRLEHVVWTGKYRWKGRREECRTRWENTTLCLKCSSQSLPQPSIQNIPTKSMSIISHPVLRTKNRKHLWLPSFSNSMCPEHHQEVLFLSSKQFLSPALLTIATASWSNNTRLIKPFCPEIQGHLWKLYVISWPEKYLAWCWWKNVSFISELFSLPYISNRLHYINLYHFSVTTKTPWLQDPPITLDATKQMLNFLR